MALYSKSEFARISGIPTNALAVYIGRQKSKGKGGVVTTADNMIDDTNEFNKLFLEKRKAHTNSVEQAPPAEKPPTKPTVSVKIAPRGGVEEPVLSDSMQFSEAMRLEKIEKIKKMQSDRQHRDIQIAKLQGELIPTELIRTLLTEHSTSLRNSFFESVNTVLVLVSQQKELTGDEVAAIKEQLAPIVNKSVDSAVANTRRRITIIVKEYADKKSIGEHG